MKFKIIATIVVVVFLIVLTILFAPRSSFNEDGTPIETPIENIQ